MTPAVSVVVGVSERVWLTVMPVCSGETDTVMGAEFTVRARATDMLCGEDSESVTWKVSDVAVAVTVGEPLITPVAGASVSPVGSVPPI